MVLDHKKGLSAKENSQLVVTDPNFMMDVLKPETIKGVEETAKVMVSAGLQKLSIEEVHNIPWKDLKDEIEIWIRASNVALNILFPGERRLYDRVLFGFSSIADFSFMDICKGSTIRLLNFADFVATRSYLPEHLFKILELFETLRDLIPEFESLFCDQYSVSLRNEAMTIWKRLGESIKGIFMELVSSFNGFDNFFSSFFYGLKIILL
ncbi:hypothetical protein P8452_43835 [Trifolium repens]|nr:hypothetical protein P8452_43835 [Trifolium repens]